MENTMGGGMEKVCTRCGRTLPIENFGTHGRYGVMSICKECNSKARSKPHTTRLDKFSKEELVAELQRRGYKLMADPTPRELMLRLKAMGYDGELTYTKVEKIDISKLE